MELSRITMHPDVSRAMCGKIPATPGLQVLIRVRQTLSQRRQAKRNAREEAPLRLTYDQGGFAGLPRYDVGRRLREALEVGGLSDELKRLVSEQLDETR